MNYTEQDLRKAYQAGYTRGQSIEQIKSSFYAEGLTEDEYIENLTKEPEEEKDVPVLFYTIKNKIGWGEWCDVTGGNHYALNEGCSPSDDEVFYCTESQAKELGI